LFWLLLLLLLLLPLLLPACCLLLHAACCLLLVAAAAGVSAACRSLAAGWLLLVGRCLRAMHCMLICSLDGLAWLILCAAGGKRWKRALC